VPWAPKAHCRECKTGYVSKGGLCRVCAAGRYPTRYRTLARHALREWVLAHGWVCPGYRIPAHAVGPGALTVDHIRPLARGGQDTPQNLAVLCRPCNSAKQALAPGASKAQDATPPPGTVHAPKRTPNGR